jgi:hypothetical protein
VTSVLDGEIDLIAPAAPSGKWPRGELVRRATASNEAEVPWALDTYANLARGVQLYGGKIRAARRLQSELRADQLGRQGRHRCDAAERLRLRHAL